MNKRNSDLETVWAIRDSRGFNANEKAFLYTVASRGLMSSKWQKASADMGMSRDTYYRTREKLIEKKAIKVTVRMDNTTLYEVDLKALDDTQDENDNTQVAYTNTQDANENTQVAESKRTSKITKKTTMKKTTDKPGAIAPVDEEVLLETTAVLVPPTSANNRDGGEAVVETTIDPNTQVAYDQKYWASTFGKTREQIEAERQRESAADRIAADW